MAMDVLPASFLPNPLIFIKKACQDKWQIFEFKYTGIAFFTCDIQLTPFLLSVQI